MAEFNRVILIGNLTRDPELRHIPNGTAVTDLGLAVNRRSSRREGEGQSEVLFIDVTVWDRQAETCCEYLRKGRPVLVEGFLRADTWQDKNTGENRSKIKVVAERVQFLGTRQQDGPGGDYSDGGIQVTPRDRSAHAGSNAPNGGSVSAIAPPAARMVESDPEDIPF